MTNSSRSPEWRALDERMYQYALARLTQRMQTRLLRYRARLAAQGLSLDEAAWKEFLRRLYPEERRFLRRHFPEVRESLARVIQDTPLAESIATRHGRWPVPKSWPAPRTSAFPGWANGESAFQAGTFQPDA